MSKRELLKEAYLKQKDYTDENRKDMIENYEAHHIAALHPDLMEDQENCILLKKSEDSKELLEYPEYVKWIQSKLGCEELAKTTDMKVVKDILKPIKQSLKKMSESRVLDEILQEINKEEN